VARRTWSVRDAKCRFSEVVKAAQRRPQTVTRHGKPAVVVVAADEYDRLCKLQQLKSPTFADMLLAVPQGDVEFERIKTTTRNVKF